MFTWTFLKISLSQIVSRLTTPRLRSDIFLLKARCSSHFFSGVSAWINICRDLRQACIQDDNSNYNDRSKRKLEFTEVWPYHKCGLADAEPRGRLLVSVSAGHPSKVECLLGKSQLHRRWRKRWPEKGKRWSSLSTRWRSKHRIHKIQFFKTNFKKNTWIHVIILHLKINTSTVIYGIYWQIAFFW